MNKQDMDEILNARDEFIVPVYNILNDILDPESGVSICSNEVEEKLDQVYKLLMKLDRVLLLKVDVDKKIPQQNEDDPEIYVWSPEEHIKNEEAIRNDDNTKTMKEQEKWMALVGQETHKIFPTQVEACKWGLLEATKQQNVVCHVFKIAY